MVTRWAILTGEYPPQSGGVSDYTRLVATGLVAAGDEVTVFAPKHDGVKAEATSGPAVVRLPDHFGMSGLRALDCALAQARPDRLLIQYVPHAFGWKSMNLPFAAWVAARARRLAPLVVMIHELNVPFRWRPANIVLSMAHRIMARLVAGSADRVFVAIPAWGDRLRQYCPGSKPAEWLPVPSNFEDTSAERTNSRTADGVLIGHFGTYGASTTELLEPALVQLLSRADERKAMLLGRGGVQFRERTVARHPDLASRLIAPGELPHEELIAPLKACELLLQPYKDGVSSRRGSVMAGLALGRPVVTNLGELSEPLWAAARCVSLARSPDSEALTAATEAVLALASEDRADLGRRAAEFYRERFALTNTLAGLRRAVFPSRYENAALLMTGEAVS
jgi:glycosyltransferase involved in cell wall biosynthesis